MINNAMMTLIVISSFKGDAKTIYAMKEDGVLFPQLKMKFTILTPMYLQCGSKDQSHSLNQENRQYSTYFVINLLSSNLDVDKPRLYPKSQATQYTIKDILSLLPQEEKVEYKTLKDTGAIIHSNIINLQLVVAFTWECNVGEDCTPFLSVKRVDVPEPPPKNRTKKDQSLSRIGYQSVHYQYYKDTSDGKLKRIEYKNTGIKFFVETKGVGKKLAIDSIVLQLSLGMALLKLGSIIVDFLMLYIFPSKNDELTYQKGKCMREKSM